MSAFQFSRRASANHTVAKPAAPGTDQLLKDAGQAQAITTAAICATLVNKGILSADEGAGLMSQIAGAIERNVGGPLGRSAGNTLRSYSQALSTAAE